MVLHVSIIYHSVQSVVSDYFGVSDTRGMDNGVSSAPSRHACQIFVDFPLGTDDLDLSQEPVS